ncbi:MAG: hypothetical protein ABI454_06370 [Sphingomicrobium sp.]
MRAVLTFHSIDDLPGPLSFPPAALDALLVALADAKLPVLELDELLGLASRQVPAHVFVITSQVGRDKRCPGQPANYLRSSRLVRALLSRGAHAYIALRRSLRRLRGH